MVEAQGPFGSIVQGTFFSLDISASWTSTAVFWHFENSGPDTEGFWETRKHIFQFLGWCLFFFNAPVFLCFKNVANMLLLLKGASM